MPKHQRFIAWTPENELKLFHVILAIHGVKIDYAAVAKEFGPDIPGSCIASYMKRLRKKAAAMGISTKQARGKSTTTEKSGAKSGKAKKAADDTDDTDEDENDKDEGFIDGDLTQKTSGEEVSGGDRSKAIKVEPALKQRQTIGGRITKLRSSPRKASKANYKLLQDPFSTLETSEDVNGDRVFEEGKSSSEDTMASDELYNGDKINEGTSIKAEI